MAFGRVESAFLKENTKAYDIKFQTRKMVKVKIELDTDPPLLFHTEQISTTSSRMYCPTSDCINVRNSTPGPTTTSSSWPI